MECQNTGLYHLGVDSEPCENAGGRWFPHPCHTLKECIDDRPPVEPGHCLFDESIECREDSECADISISGSCINQQTGKSSSDNNCTSIDQTCPSGYVCEFDYESICIYEPGAFEEWAASITIEDPSDQAQCEHTREELGFDKDDRDDVLICEQFDAYKCETDSLFDDLDDMTERAIPKEPVKIQFPHTTFTPVS